RLRGVGRWALVAGSVGKEIGLAFFDRGVRELDVHARSPGAQAVDLRRLDTRGCLLDRIGRRLCADIRRRRSVVRTRETSPEPAIIVSPSTPSGPIVDSHEEPMHFVTANGARIPIVGLGTWELRGRTCARVVEQALRLGYRHIDTAEMYNNEREVGEGLRASGVRRDDVFITTKVWPSHFAPR